MFTTHFQIVKVDGERREVAGIITCEKEDKDGETLDYANSRVEFAKWSQEAYEATKALGEGKESFGNLREQHSKRAVGKFVQPLQFNDKEKSIYGVAKVYDDDVWEKVSDGVYNAFSVGGQLVGTPKWQGKTKFITISPREVSLVDNPALDATHFDFVRGADAPVVKMAFKHRSRPEVFGDAVTDILKGSYTLEEIGQVLDHIKNNFSHELAEETDGKEEKAGSGVAGNSGTVAASADPALTPVPNPEQTPGKVAPNSETDAGAWKSANGLAYAPDAIPDGHKPEATQPVDGQAHLSADVKVTPDMPKLEAMGDPDTQLGHKATAENEPGSNTMLVKDGGPDFSEGTSTTLPAVPVDPLKPTGAQIGEHSELQPDAAKVAPAGWEDSIEAMKQHPEIDNPYALAWYMEGEGYTPHKLTKAAAVEFVAAYEKFVTKFTSEKRAVSDKERADLADKGNAMPDGSYPIANVSDLHNAIQAIGRAKNRSAVMAHIKRRAAALGAEGALPDSWKAAESELQKTTTGAPNLMANEVEKAARLGLTGHLQNLKGHADKLKNAVDGAHAAIHDACDKCMKLAGPAFDADSEREGGQPASGDASAAQDTEVKAAKAEIEKLSKLVLTLTEKVETLAAKPAEKTETEKAAKPESVVGDPAKAQPADTKDAVAKAADDKKEQENLLTLAKAAMGIATVDGKTTRVNADPKAMDILYKKLTNATQYQAARKYMTQGQ
jgi:hypothetical protein